MTRTVCRLLKTSTFTVHVYDGLRRGYVITLHTHMTQTIQQTHNMSAVHAHCSQWIALSCVSAILCELCTSNDRHVVCLLYCLCHVSVYM